MVDQLACPASIPERHKTVLGIALSPMTHDSLIWRMLFEPVPEGEGVRLIVTANLDHISNLLRNSRFRAAYGGAWVATADGMPVYLFARLRGAAPQELVTGADLSAALINKLQPGASRPFFVTGCAEAGERLCNALQRRGFAADAIAWISPPFGFETDPAASDALAAAIKAHGATHLLFGLGAPKSEVWIHEHRHLLGDLYALAIGASLDFHVGLRRRAPVVFRRFGLEWAWRVASEPKRLFHRYFVESWYAIYAMVAEIFGYTPIVIEPPGTSPQKQRSK